MLNGNWDIAKRLIEAGADVNQWDMYGQSPLHVAIATCSRPAARNPLDTDKPNKATGRDAGEAAGGARRQPEPAAVFRRPGFGGSADRGLTPFLVAVGTGDIEVVKLLLAHGANPQPGHGRWPRPHHHGGELAAAVAAVAPVALWRLRVGGPSAAPVAALPPRRAPATVRTALARARANPQVELVKLLAAAGADVNLMSKRHFLARTRGGSALHYVVRNGGNPQLIQALLDLGLDINAKDEDGLTALDYAMGRGYVPFLQMPQPPNKSLADSPAQARREGRTRQDPGLAPAGPAHCHGRVRLRALAC